MWISKQSPICSRGAGLSHSMDPVASVQDKNFSGNTSLQKFLEPERKPKVIYTDSSLNSEKLVKISPGIIARLHHKDPRFMWGIIIICCIAVWAQACCLGYKTSFCHYRSSLVHLASSLVCCCRWWEQYHDTATSGTDYLHLHNLDKSLVGVCW